MDKKKIKLIIAREWLTLLGILMLGFTVFFFGKIMCYINQGKEVSPNFIQMPTSFFLWNLYYNMRQIGIFILFFGYPIYLLIRFIIWALRILKNKK